ncbi:hypothetical protein VTH06DRAFT_7871 [Thermothelomyces fergusii]
MPRHRAGPKDGAGGAGGSPQPRPFRTLLASFVAWKLFLLAIALGSIVAGDAYDTSAGLLLLQAHGGEENNRNATAAGRPPEGLGIRLVSRLTSWDALYFVSIARRGYLFEQEWAFGTGLPFTVRNLLRGLTHIGVLDRSAAGGKPVPEALAGIAVANTAHLLSALVLYRLGQVVWRDHVLSLVAALVHIISPAGLFLSAPYAESSYALLSFSGFLLFALSCRAEGSPTRRDVYTVAAGALFGLATAFRSNGILNGLPFAAEVLRHLHALPTSKHPFDTVRRLMALGIGGVMVAAGSLGPQTAAYLRFCSGASDALPRPWCHGYLPSVFTFVQQHYWNVGFLRYWTLSNLPLFLLAAPMLAILLKSGTDTLRGRSVPAADASAGSARLLSLVRSAAAAEVLLAVLAITTYHVQIITRISSGYPTWHWWLAGRLVRGEKAGSRIVTFMVLYASVQGALFASFLPPA